MLRPGCFYFHADFTLHQRITWKDSSLQHLSSTIKKFSKRQCSEITRTRRIAQPWTMGANKPVWCKPITNGRCVSTYVAWVCLPQFFQGKLTLPHPMKTWQLFPESVYFVKLKNMARFLAMWKLFCGGCADQTTSLVNRTRLQGATHKGALNHVWPGFSLVEKDNGTFIPRNEILMGHYIGKTHKAG